MPDPRSRRGGLLGSRENFCVQRLPARRMPIRRRRKNPFSAAVRAMQAERKVLPGRPALNIRLGDAKPKFWRIQSKCIDELHCIPAGRPGRKGRARHIKTEVKQVEGLVPAAKERAQLLGQLAIVQPFQAGANSTVPPCPCPGISAGVYLVRIVHGPACADQKFGALGLQVQFSFSSDAISKGVAGAADCEAHELHHLCAQEFVDSADSRQSGVNLRRAAALLGFVCRPELIQFFPARERSLPLIDIRITPVRSLPCRRSFSCVPIRLPCGRAERRPRLARPLPACRRLRFPPACAGPCLPSFE